MKLSKNTLTSSFYKSSFQKLQNKDIIHTNLLEIKVKGDFYMNSTYFFYQPDDLKKKMGKKKVGVTEC